MELILEHVKDSTNKRVKLIEKDNLKVYAQVKMARSGMPEHIIFYKKEHDEIINHLIAHECGHILRTFSAPEDKRVVPTTNPNIRKTVSKEVEADIKRLSSIISLQDLYSVIDIWHNGIIQQLTSFPPDIMIEKWIYDNYPELRSYQHESIKRQNDSAVAVLSNNIKISTPLKIYKASNIMNYTFFNILGRLIEIDLIKPYARTPYVKKGKKLVSLTEENYHNSYVGDIEMINLWAVFLGLSNWFEWTSFEKIPANYLNSV